MGKFVSKATDAIGITDYKGQKKATKQATAQQMAATEAQLQSTRDQIAYLERADARAASRLENADRAAQARAQPFVNIGLNAAPGYQSLLTPQGQYDYLQSNPMFQASIDNASDQLEGSAAAAGKANSGGLVDQLFKNYLATGDEFVGNQYNRLYNAVGMGQSAAMGQSASSLNSANSIAANSLNSAGNVGNTMGAGRGILGNQGDIQSAGTIARYNANQAALQGGLNTINNIWQGNGIMGEGSIPGMGPVSQVGGAVGGAQGFGGVIQGLGSMFGGMFSSDRKKKRDIVRIGGDEIGGIYKFRYLDDDTLYIGRMADELLKTRPDAVTEAIGQLWVTEEFKPTRAA